MHVNDNEIKAKKGAPGYDRLHKASPILQIIKKTAGTVLKRKCICQLMSKMVPFKGDHSLKVYMKNKPKKWGYKIWALAG